MGSDGKFLAECLQTLQGLFSIQELSDANVFSLVMEPQFGTLPGVALWCYR